MSFRKEQKIKLSRSEFFNLKESLMSRGMDFLYTPRVIKSIYFDTKNLNLFHDSEEGVLPRKKIRIRSYNNERKQHKEIKISSIEGRYKISELFSEHENLNRHFFDKNYGVISPSLEVSYTREYFSFNKLRITFDSNIRYINMRSIVPIEGYDSECVVEIKTSANSSDDFIKRIIDIPNSRFSKYSRGIIKTYALYD